MANYYASSRTNYFKVKDLEKFKNELTTFGGELDIYMREREIVRVFSV